ncbi:MAG: serine/threonine protein kinase, partial [Rhodospirillales bacterium]|nr:serine/threonine protein kinase [Rhodospirillales bacterium]
QPSACPEPVRLQALLEGKLPEPQQGELSRHLDTCVNCQQTIEDLAAGGTPWAEAAGGLAQQQAAESALMRAMAELKGSPSEAATHAGPAGPRDPELAFLTPSTNPEHLGRLGPYEVHALLGRGGMGVVLKGFDPSLRRFVAIKVLGSHLAANPLHRQRFLREARSAAAVRHANVVAMHAIEENHTLPFLVMEYVQGITVQELLDRGTLLELDQILDIAHQAACGLATAHAQGVIHRDIKPANLLLEEGTGRVKIVDFGLARAADDSILTQSGVIAGTPQYMAPEQARGEQVDHRADLFSLGSVLYALCTGRAPFQAGAAVATLYQVCEATPQPVREINPLIPEWLAVVVEKLHAKKPEERYQSAAELADLLRQFQAHLREPARTPAPPLPERPTPAPSAGGLSPELQTLVAQLGPGALRKVIGREYRSTRTLWGWPLVHIATGFDPQTGRMRIARGVIAIGNVAIGGIAIGAIAVGGIAVGGMGFGLFALSGLAIGLLMALGGLAIGGVAVGGAAIGLVALGGGAIGYYALGGGAAGAHVIDATQADPQALEFFSSWLGDWVKQWFRRGR